MKKEVLNTAMAPAAIGPYNQAVKVDKLLFVSGQIPLDPESMEIVNGSVEEEAHQVLVNIGAILRHAGYDYTDVVKTSIFLSDMNDFGKVNEIYSQYFTENQPARETVEVARLPKDVKVEISVIAWKE